MEQITDFPKELCADEAVCFIADRHNVTPESFCDTSLPADSRAGASVSIPVSGIFFIGTTIVTILNSALSVCKRRSFVF